MAWEHLNIDKPHLAYMILGGFTTLFMLCSSFVKEKLYIGEATVATICGLIFGPHAANLFNPLSWGNVDKITLEVSRVVLVVQCFAVGVELPKAYMERHWKSVTLLLVPVMTWGWLITSLFIWWMVPPLSWLEGLICAACVTATDPVLASSVVGKGKFAKRVPRHLRDLLSAESGCNDGMAFPFIYLSFYIIRFHTDSNKVAEHWILLIVLYECILGSVAGFLIGYCARYAIRFAENKQLIDRESFLVFYFVLAIFCGGSGSLLGFDDLLMAFSAGVGFSNDGWFTEKTEESHVSNVIDLLLNLAYFVYLGAIIPWELYNAPELGLVPWRLVVIAILVIFFRRIPIMLALKPFIPDVKTWREALFAGHFGPIGVGAIFAAILARAELEHNSPEPLDASKLPGPGDENYYVVQLIWPITTFIVISSILVHGSSIAVFTLGKHINTLTVTLSYTTANDGGPSWMNRLPRVQSLAKASISSRKPDDVEDTSGEFALGMLPPIGVPGNFLRRVRNEDSDIQTGMAPSLKHLSRRKRRPSAGGPVSQTAIAPRRRTEPDDEKDEADTEAEGRGRTERIVSPSGRERDVSQRDVQVEVYRQGNELVIEDEEDNVFKMEDLSNESPGEQERHMREQGEKLENDGPGKYAKSKDQQHGKTEGEQIRKPVAEAIKHPQVKAQQGLGKLIGLGKLKSKGHGADSEGEVRIPPESKARSAHAYQFGNTIIVEDEDGEVIKKYTIPETDTLVKGSPPSGVEGYLQRGLKRMGEWLGKAEEPESSKAAQKAAEQDDWLADDGLRFTVARDEDISKRGVSVRGNRMNKQEFIRQIRNLDQKARHDMVQESDAPEHVKKAADEQAEAASRQELRRPTTQSTDQPTLVESDSEFSDETDQAVPGINVAASLAKFAQGTSAEQRRRHLGPSRSPSPPPSDSDDDGTERIPPSRQREAGSHPRSSRDRDLEDTGETPAERRRRLAALGELNDIRDSDTDSDSDELGPEGSNRGFRQVKGKVQFADGTKPANSKTDAGGVSYRPGGDGGGGSSSSKEGTSLSGNVNDNGNNGSNNSGPGSSSGSSPETGIGRGRRRRKISWA